MFSQNDYYFIGCCRWNHSENWFYMIFDKSKRPSVRERTKTIATNSRLAYMFDHVIDERILMPASGYLFLIWQMIGKLLCLPYNEIPIVFEDVSFLRATHLSETAVKLTLSILKGKSICQSLSLFFSFFLFLSRSLMKEPK